MAAKPKPSKSAPPTFVIPPAPQKSGKTLTDRQVFDNFINKHKALKPYVQQLLAWTQNYGGISAAQLAAAIWSYTKGNPTPQAIAQMAGVPKVGATNAAGVGFTSTAPATSPDFWIQAIAWKLSGATTTYGSVDQGYTSSYGASGSASPVSRFLPGGYVGTPGRTPNQKAAGSVTQSNVTNALKDPWVVLTPKGFKYVNSVNPPKNTVTYGQTPIRVSQFNQAWKQSYQDTYYAYTGKQATPQQIVKILAQAPSPNELAIELTNQPSFQKSPVWKRTAPGLIGLARSIMGQNWKPSGGIIRQAIANNWDQATFEAHIRQLPGYQQSPEFRTNLDQNTKAFENVYGVDSTSDPTVQALIKDKTQAGWTPDQLALWARQQPAYKSSPAYQAGMVSFLQQLGLITGTPATLSQDQIDAMLNSAHNVANVTTAVDQAGGVHAGVSPANPTGTSVVPGRGTIAVH